MLVRILLVAVAGLAVAWLAVEAVGAHAEQQLTTLTFAPGRPSAAERARAAVLTRRAGRLNPDPHVDLYAGVLDLRLGRTARAAGVFATVARGQPEDLEAWALAARAAQQAGLRGLARSAAARVRTLAPPVPRPPG
jgi:Flp pilus assembly protein TadD